MNKITKITLAVLGGVEATFSVVTPIILSILWVEMVGLAHWTTPLIYLIGSIATLFRAIKIGGWLK